MKKKNRINYLDINKTPTTSLTDIKQHVSSLYVFIINWDPIPELTIQY